MMLAQEIVTYEAFSIFCHLSKVFDMGEEEHDIILQKVQESKVRRS